MFKEMNFQNNRPSIDKATNIIYDYARLVRDEVLLDVLTATGLAIGGDANIKDTLKRKFEMQYIADDEPDLFVPRISMVACPRLDLTDISNLGAMMPTQIQIDQQSGQRGDILVSRLQRIQNLFYRSLEQDTPLELVLIIGDSDFGPEYGYNWPLISSMVDPDQFLQQYEVRRMLYVQSIVDFMNLNSEFEGVELFRVVSGNQFTDATRRLRVLSMTELYRSGLMPSTEGFTLDPDISAEVAVKLRFLQDQSKYAADIAQQVDESLVMNMTKAKYREYYRQGAMLNAISGIVLMDELPMLTKASMYKNELFLLWPWVRSSMPERDESYKLNKERKFKIVNPAES